MTHSSWLGRRSGHQKAILLPPPFPPARMYFLPAAIARSTVGKGFVHKTALAWCGMTGLQLPCALQVPGTAAQESTLSIQLEPDGAGA